MQIDGYKFTFISRERSHIDEYSRVLGANFSYINDEISKVKLGDYLAVVSPGNSFGFMDGGIDYYYLKLFGKALQKFVQDAIKNTFHGELVVGRAMVLDLSFLEEYDQATWPKYFIVAPTMRCPDDVSMSTNAYLAFKGILEQLGIFKKLNEPTGRILVPCLAVGVGNMHPGKSAWQIKLAVNAYNQLDAAEKVKEKNSNAKKDQKKNVFNTNIDVPEIYDIYCVNGWSKARENDVFMKKIK